jgi:hypothetical protein
MSSGATALDPPDRTPQRRGWNRLRVTLWIGAIEGVLVLLGVIPHLAVYLLAAIAIGFYVFVGRKYSSGTARTASWVFATSQLIAVLVPSVLHVAKWLAITVVIVAAAIGLVVLFADRGRH